MVRIGGFPNSGSFDGRMLVESTTLSRSETVEELLPPGPGREAVLTEIQEAMESKAQRLSSLAEELRHLVVGRDLVQLINSVVVPASMAMIDEGESLADGDITSSWAAKVEYLVGVALSVDPSGQADTPWDITVRVRQLVSEIFEADSARMFIEGLESGPVMRVSGRRCSSSCRWSTSRIGCRVMPYISSGWTTRCSVGIGITTWMAWGLIRRT